MTLVRDEARNLPFRLGPEERILAVMPHPVDLTPADTSSTVPPGLAAARRCAGDAATIVVGTIAAEPGSAQADLVDALLATGQPVVTVALRTPWDLSSVGLGL